MFSIYSKPNATDGILPWVVSLTETDLERKLHVSVWLGIVITVGILCVPNIKFRVSLRYVSKSEHTTIAVTSLRRSDNHILCDSFNIRKNYAMFSICEYYFHMQRKLTLIYNQNLVACEQAPSEGGKRDSVSETSGSRSVNPQLKRVGRGGACRHCFWYAVPPLGD